MSPRILVVDNDEMSVELLVALLADDYPLISTAADGFEALAKVEPERPDLVLLDIMMPDLDGFEVCRRIKANPATAHIRVLMVTALNAVDDLVRGFEAGANDFITKPINAPALRARVYEQLRQKQDYERVREQALVDPLTGAFNRRYFDAHAPRLPRVTPSPFSYRCRQPEADQRRARPRHWRPRAEAGRLPRRIRSASVGPGSAAGC